MGKICDIFRIPNNEVHASQGSFLNDWMLNTKEIGKSAYFPAIIILHLVLLFSRVKNWILFAPHHDGATDKQRWILILENIVFNWFN